MTPTRKIEVRIPAELGEQLKEAAKHTGERESVVFTLASHMRLPDKTVILIRKVLPLPDSAYVRTPGHGAKWAGGAMLPILNDALAQELGVVLFHTHQARGPVELSDDDRTSAQRLLPTFQNLVGSRRHASVVFSSSHVAGLALLPGREVYQPVSSLRWLGKIIDDVPLESHSLEEAHLSRYDRQVLLIGGRGQAILRRSTVAVVGLGGGGSHVVQQLAHAGVGNIIGIDHDRAEEINRHRLIGLTKLDVLLRRRKTAVMARMVRRINRAVKFTGVPFALPDQRAIDALKQADVVIGCLDTLHARADLQDIAWRFLIPYIDIGLRIVPSDDKRATVAIGGNVAVFIPGQFCAWCIGFLSRDKLDKETGGRPRSYLEGMDAEAQVVSFNGVLASQAVNELLQLLTGFAPPDPDYSIKKYDGIDGTLVKWIVRKNPQCEHCPSALGARDVIWHTG